MIELDGSDGGGQVLRTALGLSVKTGKPFRLSGIRKGRPNPGLQPQHLLAVKVMQKISNAFCEGDGIGSMELMFVPRELAFRRVDEDIGTAGSINLVLQSLLIPYVFTNRPLTLTLKGGTDVRWSPTSDYYRIVVLQHLRRLCSIDYSIKRRGFYPRGGGIVEVKIKPGALHRPLIITDTRKAALIHGVSFSHKSLESSQVSERMAMGARRELSGYDVKIQKEYADSDSVGAGIALWAILSGKEDSIFIGSDNLGDKGVQAEEVGKRCAESLLREIKSQAPIDSHCADNLIPYLGLLGGDILVSEMTEHTKTNIRVTESFIEEKFHVHGNRISLDKSGSV